MTTKLPVEISGTFDIESAPGWTRFALGVCYDGASVRNWWGSQDDLTPEEEASEPMFVREDRPGEPGGLDGMLDHMRSRGGIWFGHAAGIYDSLAILERARQRGITCAVDRAQHRVTRVVMGSLELRDSYGLWPVPLDDICGALRRPVPRLPWACHCARRNRKGKHGNGDSDKGCGGWCRIGEKAAEGDPELLAYCAADCRALYDGLHALRDFASTHAINLRGTLAQTAWVAAQDELGVPESDLPWHLWRAIRKADKGGRQCIVRPRAKGPGSHHDICNAYPAKLAKTELPVGAIRQLSDKGARGALSRCRPGVYTVTVHVPDLFIPPLPWSFAGRLYFPVGEITGTWCLPELVAALERGASIKTVHSAIIWEATANIFEPLVDRWYEIRRKIGRKTPLGQWIGRLAKSLTGKLAERPDRQRVLMHPESIKVCLRRGHCKNGKCTGRCGAYEQLDLNGEIFGVPYQRLGGSSYPQWSSYLRAATRIQWLEQAERYGTDLCFGNTDSLWTIGRQAPEPLGDGLGQWEYQHAWCDLDVRSAGVYAFRELPDGEVFHVDDSGPALEGEYRTIPGPLIVRGIPWATEADWKRGEGMIDRGVMTFQRAARNAHGLWTARKRMWTLPTSADADRAMWGDRMMGSGGYTVPMHAAEIRERICAQRDRLIKSRADAKRAQRAQRFRS
jgi:DNA polymerase type B, organellar and viral